MNEAVSILSLIVAALAVFVGPIVSWFLARRERASDLEVANKQIVAPMRQAWINELRELLAEFTSSALHYYAAGFEDRTDEEYRRLTLLEHKIVMMLNPAEDDHKRLEGLMRELVSAIRCDSKSEGKFPSLHCAVMELSRKVFKREWNRVKERIQPI